MRVSSHWAGWRGTRRLRWIACLTAILVPIVLDVSAATGVPAVVRVEPVPQVTGAVRLRVHDGMLYVLSRTDHSVLEFDNKLSLRRRIGRIGNGQGELYQPSDFDIDHHGTVWVADKGNDRVVAFTATTGEYLRAFKSSRPIKVMALRDGHVAVTEMFGKPLVRIHKPEGDPVGEIVHAVPVPGATERQTDYFNRATFAELSTGDVVAAYTYLLPPRVDVFRRDASLRATLNPPTEPLARLMLEAQARQREEIASGGFGGRHVLSDIAIQPDTGDIWLAPGTVGLVRYNPKDRHYSQVRVIDAEGTEYGFQDIEFLTKNEFFGVSGRLCLKGSLGSE
jgi:hypothetical protein